ncbi:MEDS domain-containing protein [Fictibacillus sp. 7GRE50]|jgi:MEDS: MEthanogen/methylotroph, DcmR Sensory domain|uniref:MEDS domain-containing protein n=1 Tax=Fictibacillus sp. 7GRE50 TaxID=2745878 RepID=UPI0018CEB602|nr:MEDS domain-containing protein [Fictibacillus sp. 7GRE50]MBH0164898.1 MEDS domain-containing protein [Fictibacillus sp. 7GRE50]
MNMKVLLEQKRNVHVLYSYNGMKDYTEKILNFIQDGTSLGEYVVVIENERIYRMLKPELANRLNSNQMKLVHHVNNFDFYYSSGSYHPPAIVDYFFKVVKPYVENNKPFRSWAHVEWGTMEDPFHLIEDLEKIVDGAVNELAFPLICAYEGDKMPEHLQKSLLRTHPYILIDKEFNVSEHYTLKANNK